jgi:hypothetical protein
MKNAKILLARTQTQTWIWIHDQKEYEFNVIAARSRWKDAVSHLSDDYLAAYVALMGVNHCFGNMSLETVTAIPSSENGLVRLEAEVVSRATIRANGVG